MTRGRGASDQESAKDISSRRQQAKKDHIHIGIVTQIVLSYEDQAGHYTIKPQPPEK
jgi:hypothetical protein